jgi:UDP-N-acetylglucosamine 2-epimerase (non-hydrolysing)
VVIATAQHRELLDQALGWFGIKADRDLDLMEPDQPVHGLLARGLPPLVALLSAEKPDWVLVQGLVYPRLEGLPRIQLTEALSYPDLVRLMRRATLILTDSGGIQEEAPSLGKPVLVLRDVTERPEGVEAGVAILVGTDEDRIVAEASRLLADRQAYDAMARMINPYGDGKAAGRILDVLLASG